jgi:hypothetical protein
LLIGRGGHIYEEGIDYKKETQPTNKNSIPYYNLLYLEKIKKLDIKEVIIQLDGREFHPNGKFVFNFKNTARTGILHVFLEFNKGRYYCTTNCFFNYHNSLEFIPKGEKVMVKLNEEEGKEEDIGYQWFYLNMINQDKVNKKQIENSLSVCLFVAGLILIVEFLVVLFGEFVFLLKKKENLIKKDKLELGNMEVKNKELLKLEWENHKAYTFALFSAILLIAFGVVANIDKIKGPPLWVIAITFLVLLFTFFKFNQLMNSTFRELKQTIIAEIKSKDVSKRTKTKKKK